MTTCAAGTSGTTTQPDRARVAAAMNKAVIFDACMMMSRMKNEENREEKRDPLASG